MIVNALSRGDSSNVDQALTRIGTPHTQEKRSGLKSLILLEDLVAGARNQRYLRLVEQEIPKLAA